MTNLKITEENPYFDYESPNEEEYITYNKSVNIDCQKIMNTTAVDILAHLKEGIGTMTWSGEERFLPSLHFGDLELSLQLNYYLWGIRSDKKDSYKDIDNSPMTQAEFNQIMGTGDDCMNTLFDFAAKFAGEKHWSVKPGQITINRLLLWLGNIAVRHELNATGIY